MIPTSFNKLGIDNKKDKINFEFDFMIDSEAEGETGDAYIGLNQVVSNSKIKIKWFRGEELIKSETLENPPSQIVLTTDDGLIYPSDGLLAPYRCVISGDIESYYGSNIFRRCLTNVYIDCEALTSCTFASNRNLKIVKILKCSINDFKEMFSDCMKLTSILEIDTSNGITFERMFSYCSLLTDIPLFDTSNGTNFSFLFNRCFSLRKIPLIDTSNGTNFHAMFSNLSTGTIIPNINTSKGTKFSAIFAESTIESIPLIDTSNGTNFSNMFHTCEDLINIPLIDTSKGTNFSNMFT